MKPSKPNPLVDKCFERENWQSEMRKLRSIILDYELIEELKWDKPFYSYGGGNVLVIWGFKAHCALGFCKGALLKDGEGILVKPGENTQATRKIPFTSLQQIIDSEPTLRAYIQEAIEIEKAGLEVTFKESNEFALPEELLSAFKENPALKTAYYKLTPGRQRGYLLHFSAPKQAQTRAGRIEKCVQRILDGKGFNDRPFVQRKGE